MSSSLRVAVTGGSGKIGSAIIRELVARGHSVCNLDRVQASDPVPGVPFLFVNLGRREQVQPLLQHVDAVCHLGEIPHARVGLSPEEIFATNTRTGSTVLQTAADLRLKHVVYTSTFQVYGAWGEPSIAPVRLPVDESHPLLPQNAYSLSKAANESFARFVSSAFGLSVSIFRLPRTSIGFDKRWMHWLERDEQVREMGTYLLTDDAAVAYVLAVEKALPGCETYNIVATDVVAVGSITDAMARAYPDGPRLPESWPATRSPASSAKASEMLGWMPKSNFLQDFRKKMDREPLWVGRAG